MVAHGPRASAGRARVGGDGREVQPAANRVRRVDATRLPNRRRAAGRAARVSQNLIESIAWTSPARRHVFSTRALVARRRERASSSYRIGASRPPPGWT